MSFSVRLLFVLLFLCNAFRNFAVAIEPEDYFNYVGVLVDNYGIALQGVTKRNITIDLYSVPTGGTSTYSQTFSDVSIHNGVFELKIGPALPDLRIYKYLGLTIGTTALSTREELVTEAGAVFAIRALNSERFSGMTTTQFMDLFRSEVNLGGLAGLNVVGTQNISNSAITTEKMADNAVTTIKIADNAVTGAKIIDGSVTTAKIPDSAITTAKIAAGVVTSEKIANSAVTKEKIAASGLGADKYLTLNNSQALVWEDKPAASHTHPTASGASAFIGGGLQNAINATATHSAVLGGRGLILNGSYSVGFRGAEGTKEYSNANTFYLAQMGLCVGATDANCDAAVAKGVIRANSTSTHGADYAEYFAHESALQPGDIAGLNPQSGLVRIYQPGDSLIGVASASPGVLGNIGADPEKSSIIGLLGQLSFNKEQTVVADGRVWTKDGILIGLLLSDGNVYINRSPESHLQETRISELEKENRAMQEKLADLEQKINFLLLQQ